jgi:parallel beta-helix repeat protein
MSGGGMIVRIVRVFTLFVIAGTAANLINFNVVRCESGLKALTAKAVEVSSMTSIPTEQGTVWYVDIAHGSDRNDGLTTATAFQTITSITNRGGRNNGKLKSGDAIVVRSGIYTETVRMQMAGHAGGPTASRTPFAGTYTTLMAYPGDARPVIIGSGTLPDGTNISGSCPGCAAISIWAPYVRVSGFDVSSPYPVIDEQGKHYGSGIGAGSLKDNTGKIIAVVHHIIIDNNIVHDSGCSGISAGRRGDYVIVLGNVTYNNGFWAPNQCSGISVGYSTDYDIDSSVYHTEVIDNISHDNQNKVAADYIANGEHRTCTQSDGTPCHTDGNGIIVDSDSDTTGTDHSAAYKSKTLIFRNVVYENGGRGISVFASDNVDIINNTTFHNGKDPANSSRSELTIRKASNIRIVNNIVYGLGSNHEKYLTATYYVDNVVWKNNLLFNGVIYLDKDTIEFRPDSTNLIEIDPKLLIQPVADPSDLAAERLGTFHLQSDSPARSAGVPLGARMYASDGSIILADVPPNIGAY